MPGLLSRGKLEARALIMGMFGMLECKKNYRYGSKRETCDVCDTVDDEDHRMNHCIKFEKN